MDLIYPAKAKTCGSKKLTERLGLALKKARQMMANDSLFRNAAFLMTSTAIMSVLGFGFWIFVAHLYSPSQIGIASALIAITLMISNLSMLGMNSGLMRFLPESQQKSRDINAALVTVGGAAMAAAFIYLLAQHVLGGGLAVLIGRFWLWPVFMILMAAVALNSLTDAVFIANRRAEFHTIVYTVFGLVKLVLPLLLISWGVFGIFGSYMTAVVVSLVLSVYFMRRGLGYSIRRQPNWALISKTRKYATNNYVAVLLAGLPAQLMPALIIGRLGADQAAYFSMAWTMANLLFVVPSSVAQSLLAESSYDPQKMHRNLLHAVKILIYILIPAVALAILVAPHLLEVFGPQYAAGSLRIFQLLALSTFFVAVASVGNTLFNLAHRSGAIVVVQLITALVTLVSAAALAGHGLAGIGLAMLVGYASSCLVQGVFYLRGRGHDAAGTDFELGVSEVLSSYGIRSYALHQIPDAGPKTMLVKSGRQKFVLKVYDPLKTNRREIESEIEFTDFLSKSGIPVPKIILNLKRQPVTMAPDSGAFAVLMKYESGRHPDKYSTGLLGDMAKVQSRIHRHGIDYAAQVGRPVGRTRARFSPLSLAPKGYSHFDFDGTNILVKHDRVACVLDFEGVRYDSVVGCIFFTLSHLYNLRRQPVELEVYLQSYQSERRLNFLEKLIIRLALASRFRSPRLLRLRY